MSPRFAQAMLLDRSPNGSGLAVPPPDGTRYVRAVSWRLLLPIRISSSPAGDTSKEENEISPLSETCSHFPSGTAQRCSLLSVAPSVLAYSHRPSRENRTVPPRGADWVGPRPPGSTGSLVAAPVSTLTSERIRTPFSMIATTTVLPSGDQSFAQPSAILCSVPPSAGSTHTADLNPETASLNLLNAIRRPSGENRGPVSKSGCVVRRSGPPESISFT